MLDPLLLQRRKLWLKKNIDYSILLSWVLDGLSSLNSPDRTHNVYFNLWKQGNQHSWEKPQAAARWPHLYSMFFSSTTFCYRSQTFALYTNVISDCCTFNLHSLATPSINRTTADCILFSDDFQYSSDTGMTVLLNLLFCWYKCIRHRRTDSMQAYCKHVFQRAMWWRWGIICSFVCLFKLLSIMIIVHPNPRITNSIIIWKIYVINVSRIMPHSVILYSFIQYMSRWIMICYYFWYVIKKPCKFIRGEIWNMFKLFSSNSVNNLPQRYWDNLHMLTRSVCIEFVLTVLTLYSDFVLSI